jgi:plastocyanin
MNINVAFNGNLAFSPANITAPVGTLVTFYFPGGSLSHSVTQSSFANPCTYLAASNGTSGGFDSGLVPTASTFTINITDTNPIWFHCKQVTHCPVSGMVGSINAPTTGNTFAAFQSAAMALGSSAPTETDHGAVTGGVGAVATAGPTSDTGSSSSSSSSSATKVVASAGFALLSAAIAIYMA